MGVINTKIDGYISEVCSYVKFKRSHKEIRIELFDHLQEKIHEFKDVGISEEEAVDRAIKEMGESADIGKQLNKIHKAVPEWSILILTIVFSLVGLLTTYSIVSNLTEYNFVWFYKSLTYNMIGFGVIGGIYLFDCSKLEKYSKQIYIFTTLILVIHFMISSPVNGMKSWIVLGPMTINYTELSLFLYTIALSKIIKELNWNSVIQFFCGLLLLFIPIGIYCIQYSLMAALIYFVVFIFLMFLVKIRKIYIFITLGISAAAAANFILKAQYRIERFISFINPNSDPQGAGYINIQISKLLNASGLFGNGFTFPHNSLPEIQSDYVLTYIIYTFGWVAGITVIVLALTFIMRILLASHKVKSGFGILIIQGFMCIFALEFVWNILMVLGLAPITAISLPFISNGGSNSVIHMAAVGIILSIYRGKSLSMVPSLPQEGSRKAE